LNGNLWVGPTSATGYKLGVSGATLLNGLVVFGTYGTGVGMYWDNANNSFGIGNTSPSAKIDVLGINLVNVKVKSNTNSGASIYQAANDLNNTNEFGMWGSTRGAFGAINSGDGFLYSNVSLALTSGVDMKFGTGATPNERMRLTAAGRLLLGLTAESTFLLDVNGTARVSGALTLSSATPSITLGGDLTISNTVAPSRSISIDVLNSNINLLAGGFGEGYYLGNRLTGSRTDVTYVAPNGLFAVGSSRITAYDGNGNVLVQAANNGNRSICLRPIQSVLIGDITTGNGTIYNAILRCDSTDRGFMPPRMTTTQKNAIASPTAGLMVFDTTLVKLCVHNGTTWETITSI
jgi:hypothetical protein